MNAYHKKRKAKIEALKIASSLCFNCDMGMWDDSTEKSEDECSMILDALEQISGELDRRADRMDERT
jgi:hypothetical protein